MLWLTDTPLGALARGGAHRRRGSMGGDSDRTRWIEHPFAVLPIAAGEQQVNAVEHPVETRSVPAGSVRTRWLQALSLVREIKEGAPVLASDVGDAGSTRMVPQRVVDRWQSTVPAGATSRRHGPSRACSTPERVVDGVVATAVGDRTHSASTDGAVAVHPRSRRRSRSRLHQWSGWLS